MTQEEEEIFREKIVETIIPYVANMTEEQVKNIIKSVEAENESIPKGFGNMLYEEIIIYKYSQIN